ncbi:hypothetical protein N431DRAFT_474304 [Stipitochalara longipes BDJ]|nr:hypothetical protein N431DRAFT_474304 [Stipitochalara longipes BDJ]
MANSMFKPRLAIWLVSILSLEIRAQTIQVDLWNVPSGKGSDLQSSFTNGDVLPVSWNKLATTPYLDTTNNLVDLWVTAWPPTSSLPASVAAFSQILTSNINLTASGGTYQWTISIPAADLAVTPEYVLRFKIANPTYDPNSDELSSLGFLILQPAAKTSSASTSAPTTSGTASSSPTTSTPAAQTSLTNKNPVSSGLSGGAKAGIAVGAVVVALGAAALIYFFFMAGRKRGLKSEGGAATGTNSGTQLVDKPPGHPSQPVELQGQWQNPAELHGNSGYQDNSAELPGR